MKSLPVRAAVWEEDEDELDQMEAEGDASIRRAPPTSRRHSRSWRRKGRAMHRNSTGKIIGEEAASDPEADNEAEDPQAPSIGLIVPEEKAFGPSSYPLPCPPPVRSPAGNNETLVVSAEIEDRPKSISSRVGPTVYAAGTSESGVRLNDGTENMVPFAPPPAAAAPAGPADSGEGVSVSPPSLSVHSSEFQARRAVCDKGIPGLGEAASGDGGGMTVPISDCRHSRGTTGKPRILSPARLSKAPVGKGTRKITFLKKVKSRSPTVAVTAAAASVGAATAAARGRAGPRGVFSGDDAPVRDLEAVYWFVVGVCVNVNRL